MRKVNGPSPDFPLVLIGIQCLEGETMFKDVVKVIKDKREFDAFKKEIRDNCKDMWGKHMVNDAFHKFEISYSCACDDSYEQWRAYVISDEDKSRISIG